MIDVFDLRDGELKLHRPLKNVGAAWAAVQPVSNAISSQLYRVQRGRSILHPGTTKPRPSVPQFKAQPVFASNPSSAAQLVFDVPTGQIRYPRGIGKNGVPF